MRLPRLRLRRLHHGRGADDRWRRLARERHVRLSVAEINGASHFYEVAGDGEAVVLIHSGIADSGQWDPQFGALAEQYCVLRYDIRGFGRTSLPPGPYSLRKDLEALLAHAGVERASIVGNSLGGRLALDLAVAAPTLVRSLVLVAPGLVTHEWSAEVKRFGEAEDAALEADDLERAVDLNLALWLAGPSRSVADIDPGVVERVRSMQRHAFEVQLAAESGEDVPGPPELLAPPAEERLAEVRAPTLILVGDRDVADMLEIARRLEAGIAGSRLVALQGLAHLPNLEGPEVFNETVFPFLAGEQQAQ